MMPPLLYDPVPRATVEKRLAGHIADRDAFVIVGCPPDWVGELAETLREISTWTGYLDAGISTVLRTSNPGVLTLVAALAPVAVVVTIPKTVPAAEIAAALGQPIPDDGSQDLVMLCDPDRPAIWPVLFVDALAKVDPKTAATIYASDLRNQS
jgi:hypothetical protein